MVLGPALQDRSNVFLTGATGLIGGEVARRLVDSGVGKLWTLVRPTRDASPAARLAERFGMNLLRSTHATSHALRPVAGDLVEPALGLSPPDADEVRNEADVIIHSAAETSFIRANSCVKTNVTGVERLLEFVRGCKRAPLLVYISTAYTAGVSRNEIIHEDHGCRPDSQHFNEYTRSKAVAEQLVRNSGLRVLVVRPSIVLSAGLTSRVFARAILWFVPLLRDLDAVPVDPNAKADVVTVQFVAESIIELLRSESLPYDTYNISAGAEVSSTYRELSRITDAVCQRLAPLNLIDPREWTRELHKHFIRSPLQRKIFMGLRAYLPFLNMNVLFDNTRLRETLGDRCPVNKPLHVYLSDLLHLVVPEPGRTALPERASSR